MVIPCQKTQKLLTLYHKRRYTMTIKEFINKVYLIGSLLENISYDKATNIVCLEIDFCYWQQSSFEDGEKETGIVLIEFSNCSNCTYDNYKINSDEIVKVELLDNSINICVESDVTGSYHNIQICANNVNFIEK